MSGTKKVRIGVIGLGGMGREHAGRIERIAEAELCAVSDIDADATAQVAGEHKIPGFTDYRDLVQSNLVDAVLIATPHYFHPDIGVSAMENGLHCLCEKPISVSVAQGDRLLDAARRFERVFAVNHYQRAWDIVGSLKEIVDGGELGEIRNTYMIESRYRTQAYSETGGWRGTWKGEGGGVLINQGVHWIDLFILLGGMPRTILARTRAQLHKIEVEDEVSALLEYPNHAWGYYHISTNEPPESVFMDIVGEKGRIVYQNDSFTFYSFRPPVTEFTYSCDSEPTYSSKGAWAAPAITAREVKIDECKADGHEKIIRNFCRSILFGEKLIAPGEEGIGSVEFVNACVLSGMKNRAVEIPVAREEYEDLLNSLKEKS